VVLIAALIIIATTSCQECEVSCAAPTDPPDIVTAEVVSIDGSLVTFAPTDPPGDPVDVVVHGSVDALDEGATYSVPLHPAELERETSDGVAHVVEWEAALDSDCSCTSMDVSHTDGSPIDTSVWAVYGPVHIAVDRALIVIAVVFVVVVGAWALRRHRQGLPL